MAEHDAKLVLASCFDDAKATTDLGNVLLFFYTHKSCAHSVSLASRVTFTSLILA